MKKLFTLIAAAVVSLSASAGNTYYVNYVQLHSLPAGAGQVYVSESSTVSDADWTESEVAELQSILQFGSFYLHAKPNDGWQVAGFAATTLDTNGDPVYTEELFSTSNPASVDVTTSDISSESRDGADLAMPLDPNRVYLALYTHVKPAIVAEFAALGSVSISKIVNYIGDKVTLTATPDTAFDPSSKFAYWEEASTGRKITEAEFTVDVTGVETYTAHFTSDLIVTLDFPAEGGYKLFWSDRDLLDHSFPENVYNITFQLVDSVADGKRYTGAEAQQLSHYFWQNNTPTILYGTGKAQVLLSNDTTVNISEYDNLITAQQDVNVDTMAVAYKYYTIDVENTKFDLIQPGTLITAGTHYIRFAVEDFKAGFEETPEVLYWLPTADDVVGINGVEAAEVRAAAGNDKIYTLGGMQVKRLGKGIYILNGKKVYNP